MAIKAKWNLPAPTHKASWATAFHAVEKLIAEGRINPEKGFVLYLTDGKVSRTSSQNAYYFGVIVKTMADASGVDSEDLHEIFKTKYAPFKMVEFIEGKRRKARKSTRDMTKEEFSVYIEKCIAFCSEYGIVIPSPERLSDSQYLECVADGIFKSPV